MDHRILHRCDHHCHDGVLIYNQVRDRANATVHIDCARSENQPTKQTQVYTVCIRPCRCCGCCQSTVNLFKTKAEYSLAEHEACNCSRYSVVYLSVVSVEALPVAIEVYYPEYQTKHVQYVLMITRIHPSRPRRIHGQTILSTLLCITPQYSDYRYVVLRVDFYDRERSRGDSARRYMPHHRTVRQHHSCVAS